jgi:hypothetical protein
MKIAVVICGMAWAVAAPAQTDWRFAHPDADFRLSANLQAVLKSPAVAKALQQVGDQPDSQQKAQMQFAMGLLSTIDRIAISARQTGATPGKDSDALILVSGSFDAKTVQGFFPSSGTTQARQVGAGTVLIGQGASFTQALRRMSQGAAAAAGDGLEQSDIWIAGGPGLLKAASQAPPAFQSLRGFSVGLNFGDVPELNMLLSAADAAGAAEVLAGFHELMSKAIEAPETAALLEKALDMRQEGAQIHFRLVATPGLMQAAQSQAASSGPLPASLQPLLGMLGLSGAGTSAGAPAPANGGKIVIYGLDDGPHEVKPQPRTSPVVTLPGR